MATTIHDLAVAYGKEHQGTVDIEVFEAGANAVLEEIESIMQYNKADERPWLLRGNHLFHELQKKIKELKG